MEHVTSGTWCLTSYACPSDIHIESIINALNAYQKRPLIWLLGVVLSRNLTMAFLSWVGYFISFSTLCRSKDPSISLLAHFPWWDLSIGAGLLVRHSMLFLYSWYVDLMNKCVCSGPIFHRTLGVFFLFSDGWSPLNLFLFVCSCQLFIWLCVWRVPCQDLYCQYPYEGMYFRCPSIHNE